MKHAGTVSFVVMLLSLLVATPVYPQEDPGTMYAPPREAMHGIALGRIGQSGLRALLSSTGNLGDLQNRTGSYRLAAQLEFARSSELAGRIAGLDQALASPDLPENIRADLKQRQAAARSQLANVPDYHTAYRTATAQSDALVPFGFAGRHPLFLFAQVRSHFRTDRDNGLTVFSEAVSIAPVRAASDFHWIISAGITAGRTDVRIHPFDGHSGSNFLGPRISIGRILSHHWSAAMQTSHIWARSKSEITRPGPTGDMRVSSGNWSQATSVKGEISGTFQPETGERSTLTIEPDAGVFFVSKYSPATRNSLGEISSGPFGKRENIGIVRTSLSARAVFGAFTPGVSVGGEHEFYRETTFPIDDATAIQGSASLSWTWSRGRRLFLDYSFLRGVNGRRMVSDVTVVVVLDG